MFICKICKIQTINSTLLIQEELLIIIFLILSKYGKEYNFLFSILKKNINVYLRISKITEII